MRRGTVCRGLTLIIASRRRHFNMGRERVLTNGKGLPRVLMVDTAPVPEALKVVLCNSLSVSIVSRLPGGHLPVGGYIISAKCHPGTCRFVEGRITRKHRYCIVYPVIRRDRTVRTRGIVSCYRVLSRALKSSVGIDFLRKGVGRGRGSRIVGTFKGGRVRILISAAIIRIKVSIPGTAMVVVRGTRHFKLTRLRRLEKEINHKGCRSCYVFVATSGSGRAGRQLSVLGRSGSNFFVTDRSLQLHNPKSLFKVQRDNILSFGITSMFRSTGLLRGTDRRTSELLLSSPRLRFPRRYGLGRRLQVGLSRVVLRAAL